MYKAVMVEILDVITRCPFGKPAMLLFRETTPASRSFGNTHKQDSWRMQAWHL